jgi:hypothetical protein
VTYGLGLTIESLVALLLVLTIGYCIVLNGRLKRLKTDEQALRDMIAELVGATEKAERAVGGLKLMVHDCDRTLGERLRSAERLTAALEQRIAAGEKVLGGVAGVSGVAAALPVRREPPPHDAKAVVAAAHAFAERVRSRAFGQAA